MDILRRPTKEEKSDGCGGASRQWGHSDGATGVHGQATLVGPDSTTIKSVRRCVLVGTKGELQGLASKHANEHTRTKLQEIFNYVHCSATPQREAAPATKATRGQSQVPDRGTDSRSAGFPPPPPIKWTAPPPPPPNKMDSGAAEEWLGRIVVNLNRYILVMALASAWASAWMHQHCAEIFWVVQLVQQICFRQSIVVVHPPFGGN